MIKSGVVKTWSLITNLNPFLNLFHHPMNQKCPYPFLYSTLFVGMETHMINYHHICNLEICQWNFLQFLKNDKLTHQWSSISYSQKIHCLFLKKLFFVAFLIANYIMIIITFIMSWDCFKLFIIIKPLISHKNYSCFFNLIHHTKWLIWKSQVFSKTIFFILGLNIW